MEEKIIETEEYLKNNQYRCPNCSSTEILFDKETKKLKCSYCKTIFEEHKFEDVSVDISKLEGKNIYKGAKDIKDDDIVTITCNSCGAEVVIDSKSAPYARCHWCHSILSLDNKIENGAVPDVILPFKISREEAVNLIVKFINKRKFFSRRNFKKNFNIDDIQGVYFPYIIVDANANCCFEGIGEHTTKYRYSDNEVYSDFELYEISRKFDISIDDLTIESHSKLIKKYDESRTNQIINAVLPFDTENCIPYKANYLIGFSSEKRDINLNQNEEKIDNQLKDICRFSINQDLKFYDRGICWKKQKVNFKSKKFLSSYLPVWIYSYKDKKFGKEKIHYITVNGRNKEINGSVPLNNLKFYLILGGGEFIIFIIFIMVYGKYIVSNKIEALILLSFFIWPIICGLIAIKYVTIDIRHKHESETRNKVSNIIRDDKFVSKKINVRGRYMKERNNEEINGDN